MTEERNLISSFKWQNRYHNVCIHKYVQTYLSICLQYSCIWIVFISSICSCGSDWKSSVPSSRFWGRRASQRPHVPDHPGPRDTTGTPQGRVKSASKSRNVELPPVKFMGFQARQSKTKKWTSSCWMLCIRYVWYRWYNMIHNYIVIPSVICFCM